MLLPSTGILSAKSEVYRQREEDNKREMKRRKVFAQKLIGNKVAQAKVKEYLAENIVAFFNDWLWTYDPRLANYKMSTDIPFRLFDFQIDFLEWIQERQDRQENGTVEKSRDMGFSWLMGGFLLHQYLFVPGYAGAIGSRKEDLVDKSGDMKAIFPKIRFMLRYLPKWMRPEGYVEREHATFLKIINPENGASITGEAGDNMGRGGRSSIYVCDEWAFVERPMIALAAISQNTECIIKGSSANGTGNDFYNSVMDEHTPNFRMFWKDDPRKNYTVVDEDGKLKYPWYEDQKKKFDPIIVASEVDIDYSASQEGSIIPGKWVSAAINFMEDEPCEGEIQAGLDIADGGKDDSVLVVRQGFKTLAVYSWNSGNTTETTKKAIDYAQRHDVQYLKYDKHGVGSGVSGSLNSFDHVPFEFKGVNSGASASRTKYDDAPELKASSRFKNLKMEGWWALRRRFEKTYEHLNGIQEHPLEELISIPSDGQLINQLSQPMIKVNEAGILKCESKEEMQRRGIKSPDRADALMYAFLYLKRTGRFTR